MDTFERGYNKKFDYTYVKQCFEERGYELVSKEYHNSHQKLEYKCNKHPEVIQSINFNSFRSGKGCRICAGNYPVKTIERANQLLVEAGKNIECLEFSGNMTKPSLIRCTLDGYEWKTNLGNALYKDSICPKCANRVRYKTAENVNQRLIDCGKTTVKCIYFDGQSNSNKSVFKCIACNREWRTSVYSILNSKHACPRCEKCGRVETVEDANFILKKLECNFICTDYSGFVAKSSEFLCLKCNKTWMSTLNNIMNGNRCPHCSASKGEASIARWLNEHGIKYEREFHPNGCKDIGRLRFDFCISTSNGFILCEYNGIQHYEPVDFASKGAEWASKQLITMQQRDKIKKEYCLENGIDLLIIPYTEFDNIHNILTKKLCS